MRNLLILFVIALLGAGAITALSPDRSLEDHAVDLRLRQALPGVADELAGQPVPVRAAFVEFAADEQLVLSARLALLRHPLLARQVVPMYADSDAFRLVLREHGPAVIPPIHYFLTHDPVTLRLRAQAVSWLSQWDDEPGRRPQILSPHQRGSYAIEFIRREGHDFLGQFVTSPAGEVFWIQSERFATEAKRFLTGGITALEIKRRLGEPTYPADYGWAAVDVLLPFAVFKGARLGKSAVAARTGAAAARGARAGRIAAAGTRSARLLRLGRTAAKAGVVVSAGYLVLNPGVVTRIGAELARWVGLPPWLGGAGLWFLLLLPVLFLLRLAWRWILRPLLLVTAAAIAGGTWLQRRVRAEPHGVAPAVRPGTGA